MKTSQADNRSSPASRPQSLDIARQVTKGLFSTFIAVALIFPSLTRGPFNWLPFLHIESLDRGPVGLGPLVLVPGLAFILWILVRVTERPARPWRWGKLRVGLPLIGLTALMLLSLEPTLNQRTLLVVLTLGLLWWVYLFAVNEKPDLTMALSVVIVLQSSVAVAQFALQSDLGLSAMGEPVLDPERSGICVLFARGQRWLRAYGMSGHPNLLGAMLSILLLLIIDDATAVQGWKQAWFTLVTTSGFLGLLTTFSRGAWLAFGTGILCWLGRRIICDRSPPIPLQQPVRDRGVRLWLRYAPFVVPIILGATFLLLHYELVASRFVHLETPVESRSITDRQVDANLAIRLLRQHPWRGVGVNNYLVAVRAIETDSRTVHNVLLLTAAELGLPGAVLWLWIALGGLTLYLSAAWAPWVAMLISGLFDVALFPTNSWYAAVLFGLLTAQTSQAHQAIWESPARDPRRGGGPASHAA